MRSSKVNQTRYKNVISEIPENAVEIYKMLPEGTRCEVIFNELIFDGIGKTKRYFPEIPVTAVEVYKMLPEGARCEVIFNELIMSPSPSRDHQYLVIKLTTLLFHFLEEHKKGTLLTAPFDVFFASEISVAQPDLFIVMKEQENIIKKNGVFGVPAIIIEILSTNRATDTKRKKALYEKAGVKEYFMIDPKNNITVLLTLNAAGSYIQAYEETGVLRSAILACELAF